MTGQAPVAEPRPPSSSRPSESDVTSAASLHVARQLERAQAGAHSTVLVEAERELRRATGDLADGPAGLHFVRVVSLLRSGRWDAVLPGCDLMVAAAVREGSQGWLSCALSLRADQLMEQEGRDRGHHDADAALRGLMAAEVALESADDDAVQRCNAHANLGVGYEMLRLYELAGPHYEAAHTESLRVPDGGANPMLWSGNLAMMHLQWALELYRIGADVEAEQHSLEAATVAELALGEARAWGDERRIAITQVQRDCALADGPHVDGVADRLLASVDYLRSIGVSELTYFAAPFVAVALRRTGRHEEALDQITRAWRDQPTDGSPLSDAAITHTRAMLLALGGSTDAAAALEYGTVLAQILWRERLRSLHTARTLRELEALQAAHQQVTLSASTDPLTGLANRRVIDEIIDRPTETSGAQLDVAVLIIDMDRFKRINDTLGHDAGDQALRAVADAISGSVRAGDTVARLGGDEFAVILPGATRATAVSVAERAVRAVAALPARASISVGVSVRVASQVRTALAVADAAMYVAKRAGGGRLHVGD